MIPECSDQNVHLVGHFLCVEILQEFSGKVYRSYRIRSDYIVNAVLGTYAIYGVVMDWPHGPHYVTDPEYNPHFPCDGETLL